MVSTISKIDVPEFKEISFNYTTSKTTLVSVYGLCYMVNNPSQRAEGPIIIQSSAWNDNSTSAESYCYVALQALDSDTTAFGYIARDYCQCNTSVAYRIGASLMAPMYINLPGAEAGNSNTETYSTQDGPDAFVFTGEKWKVFPVGFKLSARSNKSGTKSFVGHILVPTYMNITLRKEGF